jgi:hypothetical protein
MVGAASTAVAAATAVVLDMAVMQDADTLAHAADTPQLLALDSRVVLHAVASRAALHVAASRVALHAVASRAAVDSMAVVVVMAAADTDNTVGSV